MNRGVKRRRRRRYRIDVKRMALVAGALVLLVCGIWGITALVSRGGRDATTAGQMSAPPAAQTDPGQEAPEGAVEPEATPDAADAQPETTPAPQSTGPTPAATQNINDKGQLPTLRHVTRAGKKIAITVDDCFSGDNVATILDMAKEYDIKLTFFPIGRTVKKNRYHWERAHAEGHEIENHSYSHSDVRKLTEEELRKEIQSQNNAINNALDMNYTMHFFRPMGGNGIKNEQLHKVLIDMGYLAVAYWGAVDTQGAETIIKNFVDGQIILMHATNTDIEMMRKVIPAALEQGYELVTMNELLDLPPNQVSPRETTPG